MAAEVLRSILSFTVRIVGQWTNDLDAGSLGVFIVFVDIGHAHHDGVAEFAGGHKRRGPGLSRANVRIDALFSNNKGTFNQNKMVTKVAALQPFCESKSAAPPN